MGTLGGTEKDPPHWAICESCSRVAKCPAWGRDTSLCILRLGGVGQRWGETVIPPDVLWEAGRPCVGRRVGGCGIPDVLGANEGLGVAAGEPAAQR